MIRLKLKSSVAIIFILLALCIAATPVSAKSSVTKTDAEIQYLLKTIEESGCTFKRNWSEYPAEEARGHMEMKYDYAKDKITETEQFIKYIATKSSVTGREYIIICDGKEYSSAQWLTDKLTDYRSSQTSKTTPP